MDYLQINELYHHGIKGMKWGVRRFQDENSTLTAKGGQRYRIGDDRKDEQDKRESRHAIRKKKYAVAKEVVRGAGIVSLGAMGLRKTIPRAVSRFASYGVSQPGTSNLVKIPGGTPEQKVAAIGAVAIAGALAAYGAVKIGKGIKKGINYAQKKKEE